MTSTILSHRTHDGILGTNGGSLLDCRGVSLVCVGGFWTTALVFLL